MLQQVQKDVSDVFIQEIAKRLSGIYVYLFTLNLFNREYALCMWTDDSSERKRRLHSF